MDEFLVETVLMSAYEREQALQERLDKLKQQWEWAVMSTYEQEQVLEQVLRKKSKGKTCEVGED